MSANLDADALTDVMVLSSVATPDAHTPALGYITILDGPNFEHARAPIEVPSAVLVELVDVNGDQLLDITQHMQVLYGQPDGGFATPVAMGGFNGLRRWGDVNRDGLADYLYSNPDDLQVFLGAGNGAFLEPVVTFVGIDNWREAFLTDVDGDGDVDLVGLRHDLGGASTTGDERSILTVLFGSGDGQFSTPNDLYQSPEHLGSATYGDFDCDQRSDVVLFPSGQRFALLFLGQDLSGGNVSPRMIEIAPDDLLQIRNLAGDVGDVTGDGAHDLVVAVMADEVESSGRSPFTGATVVLVGDGRGGFLPERVDLRSSIAGSSPWTVTVGDVNADGKADLLVSDSTLSDAPTVSLWVSE